jgi:phospho-N-acetylmuramoyl-pentapeptide-transferase
MGGLIFLLSLFLSTIFFLRKNPENILILLTTLSFGLIGFLDDFIKITKKRSLGLRAYQKLLMQIIFSVIFIILSNLLLPEKNLRLIKIPFTNFFWNSKYFFVPIIIFILIGSSNAVNLTDGLDGLAAGITVLLSIFFTYAALKLNSPIYLMTSALTGSLLSFLLFNFYPAKVFMGDAGSLALGAFLASASIILNLEIFLAISGIVFVTETLSVIIQVLFFKITHGKRIFKMTPLHHHFELSGWRETKIVSFFYIFTAITCVLSIFILSKSFF